MVYTVAWLTLLIGFTLLTLLTLVDEAEGADWADGAEMALRINALFYFYCLGHKEFKNIAHNGLWELYAVTWSGGWMGLIILLRLLRLLKHRQC